MADKLNWGIIGAGGIARAFAAGVAKSRTGTMVAVGSRTQENADRFASENNVPKAHGSYEALLADDEVEAVYISTPHPMHAEWAIKAAEAGKHILCEKPIGINHAEAMAIVEAARRHDVFLMEAFMYRCHPQTRKLVELVQVQHIGEVRVIQASFSFHAGYDADSRLFANRLGGGGILDVGCYCTSLARLVAGVAQGEHAIDPDEVTGVGVLGETGVDEYAMACLKFPGNILAMLSTGVSVHQDNAVRIFGTKGRIVLPWPWIPAREGGTCRILTQMNGQDEPTEHLIETDEYLYAIEADTVADHLDQRQASSPAMTWNDTLGNMQTLDRWRRAIGLVYESEHLDAPVPTVHRRQLQRRAGHNMQYSQIPGVDKPVSRLVMGVDNQMDLPHASVMFDDFFENGGNAFDTAYVYGSGLSEQLLGRWIHNRALREQVVILDKGAHTPFCTPKDLVSQLAESLDRMQTDYVDIYMMHRDNPDIPVGEFVDAMDEQVEAGRTRAIGVSNWSTERIQAALDYSKQHDRAPLAAVSNQMSLARMLEPPWPGCFAADRDWHVQTRTILMPWSSQGRGFFTGKADPDDTSDEELVRCFYCSDNFARLERVRELADRRDVPMIVIALAWVLNQPFLTFPLIGPRTLEETRISLQALDVTLSPEELAWLNLED